MSDLRASMRGMGRHTATDGSSVHPLVAEGLARRASATTTHPTPEDQGQQSGEVGWPAPPNRGQGLGWPGDLSADGQGPAEPAPRGRRGWRRLFGASPAA
jgi:hypothetical protein